MAAIPFFILVVVLSQFLLLHSVEGEDRNLHQPDCRRAFPCGNLGDIKFPYTQSDRPECGLFVVDGCNKSRTPKVQLEQGGRWYPLDSISQADTVTIYDEVLAKQLKNEDCQSLNNLSFPNRPYVTFEMVPHINVCKCEGDSNRSLAKEFSYTVCKNYSIYYTRPEGIKEPRDSNRNDRLLSLCNCPIIQLPFTKLPPNKNSQHNNNLFKLLTPNVSLHVSLTIDCWDCHHRGGRCLANKQKFYCSKGENKLGLKLGLEEKPRPISLQNRTWNAKVLPALGSPSSPIVNLWKPQTILTKRKNLEMEVLGLYTMGNFEMGDRLQSSDYTNTT
ncbi:hypothetical protein DITRI_Ditri12bG0078800 [Diplodiscus trichospermus]